MNFFGGIGYRPAAEATGERFGLIGHLELETHQYLAFFIAARKARKFKPVLIQPNPHCPHLA
jgi:hypothetical protein